MNTPIESGAPHAVARKPQRKSPKGRTYIVLAVVWAVLVGGGVWGAKAYTDRLKQQIQADLAAQTEAQLAVLQENYTKEIGQLRDSLNADMAKLQTKIDTVNQLLAFTKDSASSKTDNSNQLYTQLAEVKKKLDDLKKQLDALQ